MAYNKVVYDGDTLIDLTQDDVTASDVKSGVYFHGADGVRTQGTLVETTYTATSPIDITDNDISHEDSGVTAGTYDGGTSKDIGVYFPSFTVDGKGHITSATDLGTLVPTVCSSNASLYYGSLVTGSNWRYVAKPAKMYDEIMSGTATSATFNLYDYNAFYGDSSYVRVLSVEAVDDDGNAVIVDWSVNYVSTTGGKASYVTLTVNIAEPYGKALHIKPIVAYGINPM